MSATPQKLRRGNGWPASRPWQHLYKTRRWAKLRAEQLAKEPHCRYCKQAGRVTLATVVDHKTPHRGDTRLFFDEGNLASSCKPCHDGMKQQKERSGTERGCNASGTPLDPTHWWNDKD
jgi:5-methylcytosine-specific restriction endonuclease McrA